MSNGVDVDKVWEVVRSMKKQGASDQEIQDFIEDSIGIDYSPKKEIIPEYKKPTFNEFKANVDEGYWNKEENISEWGTKYFQDQGIDIGFEEHGKFTNKIKVIYNGEETDKFIALDNRSHKEIYDDLMWEVDKRYNPKKMDELIQQVLNEKLDVKDHNIFSFDGEENWLGQLTGTENRAEFINKISGGVDNRKSIDPLIGTTRGVSQLMDWTGLYEADKVDMSGGITLEDGSFVPYEFLWRNRDILREKASEVGSKNILEEKLKEYGGLDGLNKHIKDNFRIYLNEDQRALADLQDEYNAILDLEAKEPEEEDEDIEIPKVTSEGLSIIEPKFDQKEKEKIKKKIINKLGEMYPSLSKNDLEKLLLYDEDGKFNTIKTPLTQLDPDSEDYQIESDAEEIAYTTDKERLIKMSADAYSKLIYNGMIAYQNLDQVSEGTNWIVKQIGELFDFSNDALPKDALQLKKLYETKDIWDLDVNKLVEEYGEGMNLMKGSDLWRHEGFKISAINQLLGGESLLSNVVSTNKTLSKLPGGSITAENYNEALLDFKTLRRALDLNININRTPEENIFRHILNATGEAFAGEGIIDSQTEDQARDAFKGYLEFHGYGEIQPDGSTRIPDHVIDGEFGLYPWEWSLGKNTTARNIVEGGADIVTGLGPLILSISRFNAAGGGKALKHMFKSLSTKLSTRVKNPAVNWTMKNLVAPAGIEAGTWVGGELGGEVILGNEFDDLWKAHTINTTTGETNLTMPSIMGISGPLYNRFTKAVVDKFKSYPFGKSIYAKVQNPENWLHRTKSGRFINEGITHFSKASGQGTTATVLFLVAETAQANIDALIKEGRFADAERMREIWDGEHIISSWLAFSVMGARHTSPKIREAFRQTVANMKVNEKLIRVAREELGLDKKEGKYTEKEINELTEKKLEEIYNSGLSIKEINNKIEITHKHNKILRYELLVNNSRKAAIEQGEYYRDWVIPQWKKMRAMIEKRPEDWTIEDIQSIEAIKIQDLYYMLRERGIQPGTKSWKQYEAIWHTVKHKSSIAEIGKINNTQPGLKHKFIKDWTVTEINQHRIKLLKEQIKKGENVLDAKLEIERLENTNKLLLERNKDIFKIAENNWNTMYEGEKAAAVSVANSLGKNIVPLSKKEWKEKGFDIKAEGAYNPKTKELFLNEAKIRETGNLGAPMHEVIHHLLRNSLKNPKTGKIDLNGKKVIDGLIKKLPFADREIVQERIDKYYKYKTNPDGTFKLKDGKKIKKPWEDYYEDYITVLSDAIINKEIAYDKRTFRDLGRVIYPMLKYFGFGKLYKYNLNSTESSKAAKDLYNMLGDVRVATRGSKAEQSIREWAKLEAEKAAGTTKKAMDIEYSKSTEKKIQDLGNEYRIVDAKGKVKIKESKDLWNKEGANKVITEIYKDLEGLIGSKAKAYEKVPDFSKEDFISETIAESISHIRNFNPGKNNNLSGWINSQINNKIRNVLKTSKITKQEFEREIGEEGIRDIEAEQRTAEEILDAKLVSEKAAKLAPNLRRSLVDKDGKPYVTESIIENVENAAIKTLGTKLPDVSTKDFKLQLGKSGKAFLKKAINDMMGKGVKYEEFIKNTSPVLLEHIPVSTWVQFERLLKPEDRIFTKEEKRLETQEDVRKAINEGLIDPNISETAGNFLYSKKNVSPEKMWEFFNQPATHPVTGRKSNLKGERKKALAEAISQELMFDMSIDVMRRPDVIERRKQIDRTTNEQYKNEIAEMAKRLDRDPNIKFSISKGVNDAWFLGKEIKEKGLDAVIDNKGNLKDIYKDKKIDKNIVDFVKNKEDLIHPKFDEMDILNIYMKEMLPKGMNKGTFFEQIPIHITNKLASKYGIEVVVKKLKEGWQGKGGADYHVRIGGIDFIVEMKTPGGGGYIRQSKTGVNYLNFKTLEFILTQKRTYESSFENTIKQRKKDLNNYNDFIVKELAKLEITKPDGSPITEIIYDGARSTFIPIETYNRAKKIGLQAKIDTRTPLKPKELESILLENHINKIGPDGKPTPVFYQNIYNVYNKNLGIYSISDFNPLGLDVMSLKDAGATGRMRFMITRDSFTPKKAPEGYEKHWIPGQKYVRLRTSFIPELNVSTINKGSNHTLSTPERQKKFYESPEYKRLNELNPKETRKINEDIVKKIVDVKYSKSSKKEIIEDMRNIDKAMNLGWLAKKKKQGMSTFDFDETLIDKGKNFIIARDPYTGKEIKISSSKWPIEGPKLTEQGYTFDFKDFVNIRGGVEGPLMKKLKNQIKKYGNKNVFVLTARPPESAQAIHSWLKSKGVNIPLKNITGLGNSTGAAKAAWMLKKFAEGYNDMYFVDDALPNVKAVKKVLDKLDVKSKVQQVQYSKSKDLSKDFNKILEESFGVDAAKKYSEAKARLIGKNKGSWLGVPGAEDFSGLVTYAFAGKGKKGEIDKKFFEEHLHNVYNKAYNDIHARKQNISNDYKFLREKMPEVRKRLNDNIDGIFTVDQAIRVYLWDKAGFEIPGLSKTDSKILTDYVKKDKDLSLFSETLSKITMLKEGYIKPSRDWLGENITMDMNNVVDRVYRKEALGKFMENREAIFGKWEGGRLTGENMNKIESILGPKHREALENMLWRMENMTNRTVGKDSNTNKWLNWVNNATGTIMFFNQRSAALQLISTLNYVNSSFNNPLRAGQAFANQKQYWKDFARIWNSDMMLQRRAGLKINVEASEIMERVAGSKNKASAAISYLLEKGFIPTKYADSFAIAMGGASYYRNRIRILKKEINPKTGKKYTEKEIEKKAWEDFTSFTEKTQQSSRPDLVSMQQASVLGRPILAFANTPMQMLRRHKRRIQDIANNRGDIKQNIGSALYYGFAQTMVFAFLQNAMFAVDDEDEMFEGELINDVKGRKPGSKDYIPTTKSSKHAKKQKGRYVQTIIDSYLRGWGTGGAALSALKNGILRFEEESEKEWNADYGNVVVDMLNVSPPIGSKARKIYQSLKSWKYNKEVIPEMGFDFDNPATMAVANFISAATNIPIDRAVMKLNNIRDASMGDFENWERVAMLMGWNKWNLGVGEKGPGEIRIKEVEDRLDKEKKEIKDKEKKIKKEKEEKEEEKANIDLEKEFIKEQDLERERGYMNITCSAVNKNGSRCGVKVEGKNKRCTIHQKVEQRKDGKKSQCKKVKSNNVRCKIETSSKSGYCYYHD